MSLPAQNKYLNGLQVVAPGLAVCVCFFSMFVNTLTHDTGIISRVGRSLKIKLINNTNIFFFHFGEMWMYC